MSDLNEARVAKDPQPSNDEPATEMPHATGTPLPQNAGQTVEPKKPSFPRPMFDRLIVKPLDDKLGEGILVRPEKYKDKPERGLVVACGPGARSSVTGVIIPMTVKPGETVLFTKFVGTAVIINGEEYLVLHETDIHYVL